MNQPDYSLKKAGDMVKLCQINYPQYKEMLGTLISRVNAGQRVGLDLRVAEDWRVLIDGRIHPYCVNDSDMSVVA